MQTSNLLLAENVMDLRVKELRRVAKSGQNRSATSGRTNGVLSKLGTRMILIGARLQGYGLDDSLEPATSCNSGSLNAGPSG